MMDSQYNFSLILPEIVLLVAGIAILLLDAFSKDPKRTVTYVLSIASLLVLTALSWWQWSAGVNGTSFFGLMVADSFSHLLKIVSYLAVLLTLVYGRESSAAICCAVVKFMY